MGKKRLLAEDPPIIVGGGSSTYIWVKKRLMNPAEPVPDPQEDYEIEFDKSQYDCFRVEADLVSYKTHDGNNGGSRHPVKNRLKHCTRFYDSGSDPDD